MTDPVAVKSLIPSPTKREHAIEGADASVGNLDVAQIITVRDVANTPPAYLPYLAWERAVDVWDPNWPVSVQRAVITAAPEVHRYKGTVYAVKRVLAALDVDATVTEWWQTTPRGLPYTFQVQALVQSPLYGGAPLLSAQLIKVIFASVLHTKPVSRAFDLQVLAKMPATLALAPVAVARSRTAVAMRPRNGRELAATFGMAPVAVARSHVAIGMKPHNGRELAATLGLACAAVPRVRVSVAMDFASPTQ